MLPSAVTVYTFVMSLGECLRDEEKHTSALLSALRDREEKASLWQDVNRKERSPNSNSK